MPEPVFTRPPVPVKVAATRPGPVTFAVSRETSNVALAIVPLLIEQHPDLIATVPLELAHVYARYGNVRAVAPPFELPSFAINQYWHPLFHHEPALMWLRDLIKHSFETYPNIYVGEEASSIAR